MTQKTVHIKTYGCQMNVYDSIRMQDVLALLGYSETADAESADLILLNTCHIREKAAEKVYSELGRIHHRRLKNGKAQMIGVAGCVAQAEGEEVMRRAPYVDMVIGSQSYHLLPEMIARAEARQHNTPHLTSPLKGEERDTSPPSRGEIERGVPKVASERIRAFAKDLRKNMTNAEALLWSAVRNKQLEGFRFRKQVPIGNYIVDFACLNPKLVIELDGGQHSESVKDKMRDVDLKAQGFEVLRFWNNEVSENLEGVLYKILESLYTITPHLTSPLKGEERAKPSYSQKAERIIELDFPEVQKFDLLPEAVQGQGSSAFVSVQEGCDKFCSFCVVPYTRGAEYSRPASKVLDEVRVQVALGAFEVTLLGQNVNAYHGAAPDGSGEWNLAQLMQEMADIEGLQRIRYTTSHPRDMNDALLRAHAENPKLMPYLHLPIQAGSDKILKAMNRKHKAADYISIIEKLRALRPDMAFSGDFIVGFPGESEEDFEATLRVVEVVGYASAYSFKYSPRPGTPAATSQEQVLEAVKEERLARLQALITKQQVAFNERSVGKTLPVVFEKLGRRKGQIIGKSPYMQSVVIEADAALIGSLAQVEITGAHPNHLAGRLAA